MAAAELPLDSIANQNKFLNFCDPPKDLAANLALRNFTDGQLTQLETILKDLFWGNFVIPPTWKPIKDTKQIIKNRFGFYGDDAPRTTLFGEWVNQKANTLEFLRGISSTGHNPIPTGLYAAQDAGPITVKDPNLIITGGTILDPAGKTKDATYLFGGNYNTLPNSFLTDLSLTNGANGPITGPIIAERLLNPGVADTPENQSILTNYRYPITIPTNLGTGAAAPVTGTTYTIDAILDSNFNPITDSVNDVPTEVQISNGNYFKGNPTKNDYIKNNRTSLGNAVTAFEVKRYLLVKELGDTLQVQWLNRLFALAVAARPLDPEYNRGNTVIMTNDIILFYRALVNNVAVVLSYEGTTRLYKSREAGDAFIDAALIRTIRKETINHNQSVINLFQDVINKGGPGQPDAWIGGVSWPPKIKGPALLYLGKLKEKLELLNKDIDVYFNGMTTPTAAKLLADRSHFIAPFAWTGRGESGYYKIQDTVTTILNGLAFPAKSFKPTILSSKQLVDGTKFVKVGLKPQEVGLSPESKGGGSRRRKQRGGAPRRTLATKKTAVDDIRPFAVSEKQSEDAASDLGRRISLTNAGIAFNELKTAIEERKYVEAKTLQDAAGILAVGNAEIEQAGTATDRTIFLNEAPAEGLVDDSLLRVRTDADGKITVARDAAVAAGGAVVAAAVAAAVAEAGDDAAAAAAAAVAAAAAAVAAAAVEEAAAAAAAEAAAAAAAATRYDALSAEIKNLVETSVGEFAKEKIEEYAIDEDILPRSAILAAPEAGAAAAGAAPAAGLRVDPLVGDADTFRQNYPVYAANRRNKAYFLYCFVREYFPEIFDYAYVVKKANFEIRKNIRTMVGEIGDEIHILNSLASSPSPSASSSAASGSGTEGAAEIASLKASLEDRRIILEAIDRRVNEEKNVANTIQTLYNANTHDIQTYIVNKEAANAAAKAAAVKILSDFAAAVGGALKGNPDLAHFKGHTINRIEEIVTLLDYIRVKNSRQHVLNPLDAPFDRKFPYDSYGEVPHFINLKECYDNLRPYYDEHKQFHVSYVEEDEAENPQPWIFVRRYPKGTYLQVREAISLAKHFVDAFPRLQTQDLMDFLATFSPPFILDPPGQDLPIASTASGNGSSASASAGKASSDGSSASASSTAAGQGSAPASAPPGNVIAEAALQLLRGGARQQGGDNTPLDPVFDKAMSIYEIYYALRIQAVYRDTKVTDTDLNIALTPVPVPPVAPKATSQSKTRKNINIRNQGAPAAAAASSSTTGKDMALYPMFQFNTQGAPAAAAASSSTTDKFYTQGAPAAAAASPATRASRSRKPRRQQRQSAKVVALIRALKQFQQQALEQQQRALKQQQRARVGKQSRRIRERGIPLLEAHGGKSQYRKTQKKKRNQKRQTRRHKK